MRLFKQKQRTRDELQTEITRLQAILTDLITRRDAILNSRRKIHAAALDALGTDASPNDVAPDELGCAETVNTIVKSALGYEAGGTVSTYNMYKALSTSKNFIKVDQPMPGDIIISPTGYGNGNGEVSNGHVGIVGEAFSIMSNSSQTGTFERNYTINKWVERYNIKGGYPVVFFRAI